MNNSAFVAAILLMLVLLAGCEGAAKALNRPVPEIVGTTASSGSPGFDYTVYVDCTVSNNGADGTITVTAELRNGGFWKKQQQLMLAEDTEKLVRFDFPEAKLLNAGLDGYRYACGTG